MLCGINFCFNLLYEVVLVVGLEWASPCPLRNSGARLDDLAKPPSNRLEKLKGNLKEFHSIRINDQWRLIFKWMSGEPYEVRIVDYH